MTQPKHQPDPKKQAAQVISACDDLQDELSRLVKRISALRNVAECGGYTATRSRERAAVERASLDVSEALIEFRQELYR